LTSSTKTASEIALEQQAPITEFEQCGIKDAPGPHRELLAEERGTTNFEVEGDLSALELEPENWAEESLESLSSYILNNHHAYAKRELPRLVRLAQEVANLYGSTETELPVIAATLDRLHENLTAHLAKDEMVLFPFIEDLEQDLSAGFAPPQLCFELVAKTVAKTTREHDSAATLLGEIRQLSHNFAAPGAASPTVHAFFDGLKEFELDLHRSIRLENDVLFPRALALENSEF
jgi:regulator of cell morphogenesis and NO signaling